MNQEQILSGIAIATSATILGTQPVWAATAQITGVQVKAQGSTLELVLETTTSDQKPQIFPINRGNDWIADIANTQLTLPEGNSFHQENPLPGISGVTVSQLDTNSIRVTVSGADKVPTGQIIQQEAQTITLGITPAAATEAATPLPVTPNSTQSNSTTTSTLPSLTNQELSPTPANLSTPTNTATRVENKNLPTVLPTATNSVTPILDNSPTIIAQTPTPQPSQAPPTPTTPPPQVPAPQPEVLFPNPTITIDGVPAAPSGTVQPVAPAPPLLPRAVAPPVGDIAVSNINAAASVIDLGSAAVIPRLSLREAPVREVLSLLARSAGLNLAFVGDAGGAAAPPGGAPGAGASGVSTITLDIENEPVQDVFNYVLQLSGLQANRRGRTIFVGSRLPQAARNIISRTLRLNQTTVANASAFLATQGAEVQQVVEPIEREFNQQTGAIIRETRQPAELRPLTVNQPAGSTGALLLRGLSVSTDERLNAITLIGEPRQIEMATSLLTQLDLRRRQVAINVKILDVNLLGTDAFNTSFSFGIGDSFFSVDGGNGNVNYGGTRPPSALQVQSSLVTPTVIGNPYSGANSFLNLNDSVAISGTDPGTVLIDQRTGTVTRLADRGPLNFFTRSAGVSGSPFNAGITDVTLATDNLITINADGTINATAGTIGTATAALPSLFQYPKRFLASLQAQITSGNAKIITDPTLLVQEGQTAGVNLTQEVVGNIKRETETSDNLTTVTVTTEIKEAGLLLNIDVERIDDNGFITLNVNPRVTSIGTLQDITIGDDTNRIALLNVRDLNTGKIRLRDGQTLILTGIIQETDRTTVSKVPILGDIPILGALFRKTERQNQRQEVIVLLTPQVLDDSERASFGYNYTPGRETQDFLERRGVVAPGRN
ncbi:MAG TPA: general secretion pathway protein GspD [Cyanobacteria bacterium UBA11153]|nr:general secretion pathway protein GspD [Cyanobacteria bacterium UBA11153]